MSNDEVTRRDALGNGAAAVLAGAAALAVSAVGGEAHAQSAADVAILNTLLRAEIEAQRAYEAATSTLMMPDSMDPDRAAGPAAAAIAGHFRSQHVEHAMRLRAMIMSAQGTPVDATTILFTPPMGFRLTVKNILRLACNKERAAAIAYVDAIKRLSSQSAAELAAAIGGVETQHFVVLYLLLRGVVTPGMMIAAAVSDVSPRAFVAIEGESSDLSNAMLEQEYRPLGM